MAVTNVRFVLNPAGTTLAFLSAVTPGSTLVVGGGNYGAAPTISDSVNGAYSAGASRSYAPDTASKVTLAYFYNTAAGTPTVTFNTTGIGYFFICEVTNAIASPLDVSVNADGASGTAHSLASGTLAQADEVIFAIAGGYVGGTIAITADPTYTELVMQDDNNTNVGGQAQYKIVSSTASDTADWTWASAAPTLKALMSLKVTAGVSAALSGTAIGGITEADVVAGGKTIIITLTGDTFIAN